MLVIVLTAFTILLINGASDVNCSTTDKDTAKNDYKNDVLKEILKRLDKMEKDNNVRLDQMEKNMNIRFDQLETDSKNISVVLETLVEQQMVITAEVFTFSQTHHICENITTPTQPDTTTPKPFTSYCAEAMGESGHNGIYKIKLTNSNIEPFEVYCMKTVVNNEKDNPINGTWLIFQRRQDNTIDFYQNWNMYQRGFGDLKGNFWLGLDKLYALTKSTPQELWVQLEDNDGKRVWAKYSTFAIGDESELYELKTLGSYEGTAGDSLSIHRGSKWSTFDKQNDKYKWNCAQTYRSAWWYYHCHESNLNGNYGNTEYGKGINWVTFHGHRYSLKYTHMAIRPRQ